VRICPTFIRIWLSCANSGGELAAFAGLLDDSVSYGGTSFAVSEWPQATPDAMELMRCASWPSAAVGEPPSLPQTAQRALSLATLTGLRDAGVEHNVVNAGSAPLSFVETELKHLIG